MRKAATLTSPSRRPSSARAGLAPVLVAPSRKPAAALPATRASTASSEGVDEVLYHACSSCLSRLPARRRVYCNAQCQAVVRKWRRRGERAAARIAGLLLAAVLLICGTAHADKSDSSRSWAVLTAGLHSKDYEVRLMTVQALGMLGVTDWLKDGLKDPEHDVRVATVDALDRIGSTKALGLLRSVRDDDQERLDLRALAAAALLRPRSTP